MQKIIIVFGKNGIVSKMINSYLEKEKIFFFCISWKEYSKYGISKILKYKSFYEFLSKQNISNSEIIFIDCFIGNFIKNEEVELHKNLFTETQSLFKESKFVYISTFEPQIAKVTKYRLMKYEVENSIKSKYFYALRIGNPYLKNKFEREKNHNLLIDLKNFKKENILVPCTYIPSLINICLDLKEEKIIRCYSGYMKLSFKITPFPKLIIRSKKESKYFIFLPLRLIYFLNSLIIKFLEILKIKNKLLILLEKPKSLIAQQSIISYYKKIL